MKIAYDISILGQGYINPKARTGIFRVVESLLLELIKRDDINLQAIALSQKGSMWENISAEIYSTNVNSKLNYYFHSCYRSRFYLSSLYTKAVQLQRLLIQSSVDRQILIYKFAHALKILFDWLEKLDITLDFKSKKYQLYHSSYFSLPPHNILGNIPRILTIHDLIPVKFPKLVTQKVYYQFLKTLNSIDKNNDWIICNSEYTKNDFCEYTRMNSDRVFITPLATASYFHPVTESEIIKTTLRRYQIPNTPYLLSLCTLEPRKNLSFLIRCFSQIIADNTNLDINLVLVGVAGWKNSEIFKSAQENPRLKSRIIFTGYIPDEDLSAIYSSATAFVYPSLYEGFGLPPLEAMQCGTPVITSNTSSLPEVVGDAGITIDPKQEDELCDALLKVINDSELRASLSQKGIERVSQFSWARCAEETIKVYRVAANQ
ncbi:glycosyl transferase family 1 [Hydrococcus rivularis NIES-593]|uniref:Glycosyl transferase family 1 n=1 Tax=Hydrococcus rivularis NIES-593 TaxID=1921803 RepID=A0A1U7HPQ3_9CYAN|nr:glycosyltransferase family 1 protein [Hydrococcus rivularis]OKH25539.1 glycosyl transferase family 1 [Hydrococcus rivularis NIES-593]